MKKLSEMSLEELWKLFPITLTEPNPCWKGWYLEEERALRSVPSTTKGLSLRKNSGILKKGKGSRRFYFLVFCMRDSCAVMKFR